MKGIINDKFIDWGKIGGYKFGGPEIADVF